MSGKKLTKQHVEEIKQFVINVEETELHKLSKDDPIRTKFKTENQVINKHSINRNETIAIL